MHSWDSEIESYLRDYELSMRALEHRFQEKQTELIAKWRSPHGRLKYAKPSPEYLSMRYSSQRMIRTNRFNELGGITHLMRLRMDQESAEAGKRLESGYSIAEAGLHAWLEGEEQTLKAAFDRRLNNIARERARSMRPFTQRSQILREKNAALLRQLHAPLTSEPSTPPPFPTCDNAALAKLNATPRLRLPTPELRGRSAPRSFFDEKVAAARKAACQLKAGSGSRSLSSVSGMDVSRGSGSASPSSLPAPI
jgi:hypothetical protein